MTDGGSAFPRATEQTVMGFAGTLEGERGMLLRDYFAAKALVSLAHAYITMEVNDYKLWNVAEDAYRLADAMLAEREKTK